MNKIALLTIGLTLAGCAGRNVERVTASHSIKNSVVSAKSVDDLSNCFLAKNTWGSPVVTMIDGRKRFSAVEAGYASFVLTMTPTDGGTRVDRQGQPLGDMLLDQCA